MHPNYMQEMKIFKKLRKGVFRSTARRRKISMMIITIHKAGIEFFDHTNNNIHISIDTIGQAQPKNLH